MHVCVCEIENSNSKTLFYKDHSLGSVKTYVTTIDREIWKDCTQVFA